MKYADHLGLPLRAATLLPSQTSPCCDSAVVQIQVSSISLATSKGMGQGSHVAVRIAVVFHSKILRSPQGEMVPEQGPHLTESPQFPGPRLVGLTSSFF